GVIEVKVSKEVARERVLGRARGADDNEEVFNNRMKVYLEPLEEIINFYTKENIHHAINGERSIEAIVADMKNLINDLLK
ncbi:adenylate kinase, partial [Campylobacter lari]|nr:adenylate kinase [Campylobacter lari]